MKKKALSGLLLTVFASIAGLVAGFVPQTAQAGLVVNETNVEVCFEYLWACELKIPSKKSVCIMGFADFPAFTSSEGLYCPTPFFTSGTTVRLYYIDGKPACCRDCISNKPCTAADATVFEPAGASLDRNGDGTLTKAEFVGLISDLYNRADQDHDQLLSRNELNLAPDGSVSIDGDRDGTVTLNEAVNGLLRVFDELDTDKDGVLRGHEYQSLATHR